MNQTVKEKYLPFLEQVLTPKRLQHSLGVMEMMIELAAIYRVDSELAAETGLLHDAAKDLPADEQAQLIQEAGITYYAPCDRDYVLYLHGPVGSYFIQKKLGLTNPLLLDAITTHTYYGGGENFHSPLVWCLRFSDILEPNRNWSKEPWMGDGEARLRRLVYEGRAEEAAFFESGLLIRFYEAKQMPVHPNMRSVYQSFLGRFNFDDLWEATA